MLISYLKSQALKNHLSFGKHLYLYMWLCIWFGHHAKTNSGGIIFSFLAFWKFWLAKWKFMSSLYCEKLLKLYKAFRVFFLNSLEAFTNSTSAQWSLCCTIAKLPIYHKFPSICYFTAYIYRTYMRYYVLYILCHRSVLIVRGVAA